MVWRIRIRSDTFTSTNLPTIWHILETQVLPYWRQLLLFLLHFYEIKKTVKLVYQVTQQHSNTAWLIGTCTVWQETCVDCSLVPPFCPKTRDWNVYKAVLVWRLLFGTFGTDWTHNDNCSWSLMVGTLSPMCLSSWFTWHHRTWQNLPASLLCFWVLQLRWSCGEKAKGLGIYMTVVGC